MYGLEFAMKIRKVSQTNIATVLDVTPQTVYKWVNQVRKIPDKYKATLGNLLDLNPTFLEQELSPQDMVYLLSGRWVEGGETDSMGILVMQEEHANMKEKVKELEGKMKRVEEESDKLFEYSILLKRHLYTIEDEGMKKTAKELLKSVDRIQNLTKGIEHLL